MTGYKIAKTKLRVTKIIYKNSGISLAELIKMAKTSPNLALRYVNELVKESIIRDIRLGGKKKVHIRKFHANFSSEAARLIFSLIEEEEKKRFLEKYKELKPFVGQINDLLGKGAEFALVYGSYARFAATEESDLDLIIVGDLNREKINRLREVFVTSVVEPSIKIESLRQFLKNKDKPLYQSILREHIVVFGNYNFVRLLEGLK